MHLERRAKDRDHRRFCYKRIWANRGTPEGRGSRLPPSSHLRILLGVTWPSGLPVAAFPKDSWDVLLQTDKAAGTLPTLPLS